MRSLRRGVHPVRGADGLTHALCGVEERRAAHEEGGTGDAQRADRAGQARCVFDIACRFDLGHACLHGTVSVAQHRCHERRCGALTAFNPAAERQFDGAREKASSRVRGKRLAAGWLRE